jgi:hypothetical protein
MAQGNGEVRANPEAGLTRLAAVALDPRTAEASSIEGRDRWVSRAKSVLPWHARPQQLSFQGI